MLFIKRSGVGPSEGPSCSIVKGFFFLNDNGCKHVDGQEV